MKRIMLRRAAAAALAGLMLSGTVYAADFSDTAGDPNREAIQYVTEQNLFSGASAERFEPAAALTRGMAAVVLAKQAEVQGTASAAAKAAGGRFSDVAADAYYAAAVDFMAGEGIMAGTSEDRFEPDRAVSRTELRQTVESYLNWLGRDGAPEMIGEGGEPVTRSEAAAVFAQLDKYLSARENTVLTHKAADGVTLTGKLSLPSTGDVKRIVLFINGSGPNTYDNHRKSGEYEFDYYDLFEEQLAARGIGFFRWNTRGVSAGDQAPYYANIDEKTYQTYVPETSVSDIHEWIQVLSEDPRLAGAEVYLLGWSEGTMIAPEAAERYPNEIDGLILAGYCNDTMAEILDWQQTGGSSMVFYKGYFDYDGDGAVTEQEFAEDRYGVAAQLGIAFADVDVNKDGKATQEDFRIMLADGRQALYDAIERKDDDWLAENYGVRLTSAWFEGHAKLRPNRERLPELSLPIEIFHGTMDQNCSVEGAYAIEKSFAQKGKTNLKVNVYEGYDHDMNYGVYLLTGKLPQGFVDLFQSCVEMKK